MAPRLLMVVGADASKRAAGPRRDFAVLAEATAAVLLDRNDVARSPSGRTISRIFGLPAAQAWLAFRRRSDFDVIFTDGEHIGIPLALLLRATRSPVKHITIGHRLSSRKKRLPLALLHAHRRMDRIVVHSRHQREFASQALGIPPMRLALVPYQVDPQFWAPRPTVHEPLVVSVGLEHRDYRTLVRAATGLDARVIIGAASHWSRHDFSASALPSNVEVASYDYLALRDLYARAAVVVVPLADVDNQAGVTTILEAMAMGKAVVVTQSLGQTDVVEDRRSPSRGIPRTRPLSLTRAMAAESGTPVEPTGFYVPPGDAGALRRAITYLLDHPQEREALGLAARRAAVELYSVDLFASRLHDLIRSVAEAESVGPALRYGYQR
jgi:glycosyltransferase involved in cell wall biosynthesis